MVYNIDWFGEGIKVAILSKERAEEIFSNGLPENAVLIGFYDTDRHCPQKLEIPAPSDRIFQVAVDDLATDELNDYSLTLETIFPQCGEMAEFIRSAIKRKFNIICQCVYGEGRSAGCAAAILEYYEKSGIQIYTNDRFYPNKIVFRKLFAALNNKEGGYAHENEIL